MDSTRGSVINHHMNGLAMVMGNAYCFLNGNGKGSTGDSEGGFLVERPLGGGRFRLCGNVAVGRRKKKRGDG